MNVPPVIPQSIPQSSTVPPKLSEVTRNLPPPETSPKQRRRAAIVTGVLFVLTLTLVVCAYRGYCTPRHSFFALKAAVERRDREGVEKYVDAPKLAESIRKCALESYRRESEKTSPTDAFERLLNPLVDQLAVGVADMTFTPDSVVSMLCGDDPKEILKHGVNEKIDRTVDGFTKDGNPKTQAYGIAGKVLLKLAAACAIDEGANGAKAKQAEASIADDVVTTEYESLNRYLISITPKNADTPAIGVVFRRHGLMTWKLSEIRMLTVAKKQTLAMAKP
jgi:hypothetical protein